MAFIFIDKLFKEQDNYCISLLNEERFTTKHTSSTNVNIKDVSVLTFGLATSCFSYDVRNLYELKAMSEFGSLDSVCEHAGIDYSKYKTTLKRLEAEIETYRQCNSRRAHKDIVNDLDRALVDCVYEEKFLLIKQIFSKIDEDLLKYYRDFFYEKLGIINAINNTKINLDSDFVEANKGSILLKVKNKSSITPELKATGSKNGRLHWRNEDFNFYVMQKHLRKCIKPKENFEFWQLDYKSFQPRIAIFGSKSKESEKFKEIDDIYSVLPGNRMENKIKLIAWMFGEHGNKKIEDEMSFLCDFKENIYKTMTNDGRIINNFGRPIYHNGEKKNVAFQTYIANMEVDCILFAMSKINKFLENSNTKILMPYHDAIILEVHKKEVDLVNDCKQIMSSCLLEKFGARFPVEIEKMKEVD